MANHIYKLSVGYGSMAEDTLLNSTHGRAAVMKAYAKGCDAVGVSLHESEKHVGIATTFEDAFIYPKAAKLLAKAGFDLTTFMDYDEDDPDFEFGIDTDEFVRLFIFLVQAGNSEIQLDQFDDGIEVLNDFDLGAGMSYHA